MFRLNISDINRAGLELFQSAESFLDELTDREIDSVAGGFVPIYDSSTNSIAGVNLSLNSDNSYIISGNTVSNTVKANSAHQVNSVQYK